MKRQPSIRRLFLLGLALFAAACANGTETGNPGLQAKFNPVSQVSQLNTEICAKLSECHETLDFYECRAAVLEVGTIDTEIGLPQGVYETLKAVITAEIKGDLVANVNASFICQEEIAGLVCDDPLVIAAFDPQVPDNFDEVYNLLLTPDSACPGIF